METQSTLPEQVTSEDLKQAKLDVARYQIARALGPLMSLSAAELNAAARSWLGEFSQTDEEVRRQAQNLDN